MSRNAQRSRKSVLTLEPMFLMSASAADVNLYVDAGVDPAIGPLPGLDFPGEWIVEAFNSYQLEEFSAFSSPPESGQQNATSNSSLSAEPSSVESEQLEIFLNDIPTDTAGVADDQFAKDSTPDPINIPGAIPVPAKSVASLAFVNEGAGYRNTIGTYLVDEATGQISDVRIAFANASLKGSGGDLVSGDAVELEVAAGKQVGFFILANGDAENDLDAVAGSELSFVPTKSSGMSLIATDASGQRVALNGNLYVSDASMNLNGLDHFRIEATDSGMLIQIEDLPNLGDKDFNDVVVELKFEAIEPVAPEFTSLNGSVTYIEGSGAVVLDANAALNVAAADSLAGKSSGPAKVDC